MGILLRGALLGAGAGAAGTAALDAATYLDMAVRGRPASSTPQQTIEKLADTAGVAIPGSEEQQQARVAGLGPLLGFAAGVGAGAVVGVARALMPRRQWWSTFALAAAVGMLAGNAPMTALGVTDPRQWSAADWASDVIPHLAYAGTAATILGRLDP